MANEEAPADSEAAGMEFRVAILLAACAVLAATIGLLSSRASGDAGGDATAAIRGDVRRGSEIVNDAARIYAEDAPLAFQVAEADLRAAEAQASRESATGLAQELLGNE